MEESPRMSYSAVTPAPRNFVQEPEPESLRSYEDPWPSRSQAQEEEEPWNQTQVRSHQATKKSPRSHRLRSWYGLRDPSDPRYKDNLFSLPPAQLNTKQIHRHTIQEPFPIYLRIQMILMFSCLRLHPTYNLRSVFVF